MLGERARGEHVSGVHLLVQRKSNRLWIRDQGSTNGTLVNDAKISRQPLKDGDVIAIGEISLRFELGEDEKPKKAAAPARASLADVLSGKAPASPGVGASSEAPKIELSQRLLQYNKKQAGRAGLTVDVSQTAGAYRWLLVVVALGVAAGLFFLMRSLF
jgi:predicted component of type VI protein secretion system